MKKIIAIAGLAITLFACTKEKDVEPVTPTHLVGKWRIHAAGANGTPYSFKIYSSVGLYDFKFNGVVGSGDEFETYLEPGEFYSVGYHDTVPVDIDSARIWYFDSLTLTSSWVWDSIQKFDTSWIRPVFHQARYDVSNFDDTIPATIY